MPGARSDPETRVFLSSGGVPNHPVWPVLLYRGVWTKSAGLDEVIEKTFRRNGWGECWRWGVYAFHHFHSNAHEALGVACGEASIRLGGAEGETFKVQAGDVIVLPAGTGHKKEASTSDFLVVGAYPRGQNDYDMRRGDLAEFDEVLANIRRVPAPETDPVFGEGGPLTRLWCA